MLQKHGRRNVTNVFSIMTPPTVCLRNLATMLTPSTSALQIILVETFAPSGEITLPSGL